MAVETDMTVATTILEQLGGPRFVHMTGARDLVGGRSELRFRLPARLAKDGVNVVRIVLTPMDVYTVETYRARGGKSTLVDTAEDIYAEDLQRVFTRMTGLVTRL